MSAIRVRQEEDFSAQPQRHPPRLHYDVDMPISHTTSGILSATRGLTLNALIPGMTYREQRFGYAVSVPGPRERTLRALLVCAETSLTPSNVQYPLREAIESR